MMHHDQVQNPGLSSRGDTISIRRMLPADIPDGMRLKAAAGWNQTDRDWQFFLDASPEGCFVAVFNGMVVGTVTTITYENRIAWIGMMLVDPEYRRRGIATRLMNHAIAWLGSEITVKLDATPFGRTVYERLGFTGEYLIYRMTADYPAPDDPYPPGVSPVSLIDMAGIEAMDRIAFGAGRHAVLNSLFHNSPGLAWQCSRHDMLTGYCIGRPGANFWQIGPIIAGCTDDAIGLTHAALNKIPGCSVVMDVPANRDEFLRRLRSWGFTEQRQLIRMYHGDNNYPGKPDMVFAITGPELG